MKKILLLLIGFGPLCLAAQVGNPFPEMETETLAEKAVMLPGDIKGKFTIIGLAYSKKSEKDLNSWFGPAYAQFIQEPDKEDIFATDYDVNLFFVPMLTGHKTLAYKKVMKNVREDTNPELYPHILFYKGNLRTYKDALKMDNKRTPYFFILDKKGKIVWKTSGSYSVNKMQQVIDKLDEELGGW